MKYLVLSIDMVSFERAKAKSIISKIRFTEISKKEIGIKDRAKYEELSIKKERSSNYFLEAIRSGGVWLS